MENLMNQAHEKLLNELKDTITNEIEAIHVWLNQNMTEDLAVGILKPERTLEKCWEYICKKVEEEYIAKHGKKTGGHYAGDSVYKLVIDFYTLENIEVKESVAAVKTKVQAIAPIQETKKQSRKKTSNSQMELF